MPHPNLRDHIKKYNLKQKQGATTIGCDPEFFLIKKHGSRVSASDYTFFKSVDSKSEIGCDGAGVPVEIRPRPAPLNRIDILINNIRDIFQRISRFCYHRNLSMIGGAYFSGRPIGGHIHFGRQNLMTSYKIPESMVYKNSRNVGQLTYVLDTHFIPIINNLIPHDNISRRRYESRGYGRLGDRRSQSWGTEYRVPYSFPISPLFTTGLFSLVALIARHYKTLMRRADKIYSKLCIYDDYMSNEEKAKLKLKELYKLIKPRLLKVMSYNSPNPQFNPHILSIFNLIERGKICKSLNVIENYGFNNPKIEQFTMFYDRHSDELANIKRNVEHYIHNKHKGEIFIYDVEHFDMNPQLNQITLSEGLPKIKGIQATVKIEKGRIFSGIPHSIGLSRNIIYKIKNNKIYRNNYIKYMSNLNLEELDKSV